MPPALRQQGDTGGFAFLGRLRRNRPGGMSGMRRCRHQSGDLYEHFKSSWVQFFEKGVLVQDYAETDEGYPTGGITFHCRDCRKRFTFKNHRKAPKWLQKYYADFLKHGKPTRK